MTFDSLLNTYGDIKRITYTQDTSSGEKVKSYSMVIPGVKGRLEAISGGKQNLPDEIIEDATHIWYMKLQEGYTFNTKDYVLEVDGLRYEIMRVQEMGHTEFILRRVEQYG